MTGTAQERQPGRPLRRLQQRVEALEHALAPALTPPMRGTMQPEPPPAAARNSGTRLDWSAYPDHDPDFIAGRITLAEARRRHPRADEGCGCANCRARRQHAPRVVEPHQDRPCPFCHGSGFQARTPEAAWTPCPACDPAGDLPRLAGDSFHTPHLSQALAGLRARVMACESCGGTGKVFTQPEPVPCSPCRGSGVDDTVVTPPGTLWRSGRGEFVADSSGDRGGLLEQRSLWTALPVAGAGAVPWASEPPTGPQGPGVEADSVRAGRMAAGIVRGEQTTMLRGP